MMPQTVDTGSIIRTDVFQKYSTELSVCNVNMADVTHDTF